MNVHDGVAVIVPPDSRAVASDDDLPEGVARMPQGAVLLLLEQRITNPLFFSCPKTPSPTYDLYFGTPLRKRAENVSQAILSRKITMGMGHRYG